MLEYYVVYSLRTAKGSGIGRTAITCELPINSMDRINQIEASIMDDLHQKQDDTVKNLFLTFWTPINPSPERTSP